MAAGDSMSVDGARRLLLVIDNLARGGAQRQAFLLVRGLAARGYAIRVLVLNGDADPAVLASMVAHAEVRVIGKVRLAAGLGPVGLWLGIRAWRPRVILTMLEVSDLLGRIAGRFYGGAAVVTSIRARNAQKPAWWFRLDRMTMRWADRVVFNSAAVVRASLETEGVRPEQACVIVNGVEPLPPGTAPADPAALGLRPGAMVILAAGRLQPQKRMSVLVSALAALPQPLAHAELLVAGGGPLLESLRQQAAGLGIAHRVHLLGTRDDLPALMALADVFVLPSAWEGMPNAVMEAMAAGCPVVATSIDGTRDLIPEASYGWLVAPDDVEQLAAALSEALGDRSEALRRAERARRRVIESFGVENMVEGYAHLFDALCDERAGRH